MLNRFWKWLKVLFCRHSWIDGEVVLLHLQFFQKQWCPVCGKSRMVRYKQGVCPHCGWYYRLRTIDAGVFQEVCINNECPNFLGGVRTDE